jgi:hypothetical protein
MYSLSVWIKLGKVRFILNRPLSASSMYFSIIANGLVSGIVFISDEQE